LLDLQTGTLSSGGGAACFITVDVAMAASQNDVCITQQKCHIMIFFRGCSMIKDKNYLKDIVFVMK
jgi:hypothetical protein